MDTPELQPGMDTWILDEMIGVLDTGDLVLFNRRCSSMGALGAAVCQAAKLYGMYDHVGVVVREGDGSLKLIDAGFNGVQYVDLRERIRRSKSDDISVRRLHVHRDEAFTEAARGYVAEAVGGRYKQSFFELVAAGVVTPAQWRRERLYLELQKVERDIAGITRDLTARALTDLEGTSLRDALGVARQRKTILKDKLAASETSVFEGGVSDNGLFCSELVAYMYQRLRLLPPYPAANDYIPMDLASSPLSTVGRALAPLRREGLPLLGGAYLSDEVFVRRHGKDLTRASAEAQPQQVAGEDKAPEALILKALRKERATCGVGVGRGLVAHMELACFRPAAVIHSPPAPLSAQHHGEGQTWVYVIEEGEVDAYISTTRGGGSRRGDGGPTELSLLGTLGRGAAFTLPMASASGGGVVEEVVLKARGAVRCWRAPLGGSADTQAAKPPPLLEKVLAHHPYFHHLTRRERKDAARHFFPVSVQKGEVVMEQGERGDNLYIVDKGAAQIVRRKGSSSFVVATLGPGSTFGEASVMFNSRRGASVVALDDLQLWALDRRQVQRITRRGSPFLSSWFLQQASVTGADGEPLMTYQDLARALHLPTGLQPTLTLKALDPSGSGVISFSELVHWDKWANCAHPRLQLALRLAGAVDTGYDRVTLRDWRRLSDVAAKLGPDDYNSAEAAAEARFLAQTFRPRSLFSLRAWSGEPPDDEASISYQDLAAALERPGCPRHVRALLDSIGKEIEGMRTGWASVQERMRRLPTLTDVAQPSTSASVGLPGTASLLKLNESNLVPWLKGKEEVMLKAGGGAVVAAMVARTAVAPLERAKILVQTGRATGLIAAFRFMWDSGYVRWGGMNGLVRGLFVGNGLNMARIAPVLLTQVLCYEAIKGHLVTRPSTAPLPDEDAKPMMSPPSPSLSMPLPMEARHLLAGGLAGVTANALLHPLDTIRARVTVHQHAKSRLYTGPLDCLRQSQGALFRGLLPCCLWAFLYIGIDYTVLAVLSPLVLSQRDGELEVTEHRRTPDEIDKTALACGLVASTLAQIGICRDFFALDLEGRLPPALTRTLPLVCPNPLTLREAWRASRRSNGGAGLYKGLPILILKNVPLTFISFTVAKYVAEAAAEREKRP